MKRWIVVLVIAGCTKKLPSHGERCADAADHLTAISTARMGEDDRRRVLASCMSWTDARLDCLLDAKDDAGIDRCSR